jgi:putative hydroxymethylpyrimidine transport system substrate-binding protein
MPLLISLRVAVAALSLLVLAAFPAAAQPAPERLTVLLDWFMNPDHAPLVIARERGLFAKHGLDVTLVEPADPSAPPRLIAARQGDIAVSYQPTYTLQIKENLPLLRLGTLIATPLNSLVTLADGPVKTLTDLKGKTIGYSGTGFDDVLVRTMLESVGLSIKDVTLVNVNFALSASLVAGRVDAIIGAFRNFELTELKLKGKSGRAFFPEEHGVPVYDELIYIVHKDRAGDPRFSRFLDAVEAATVLMLNDPEGTWQTFVKAYPKVDDALNRQAWIDTLRRFQASPAAVDPARYIRFAEFLKRAGLIETVEPAARYVGTR